jgi:hypothetical protein
MGDKNDYLRYMTEHIVSLLDNSGEEAESESAQPRIKETWGTKWFGVAPMGFMMWWRQFERKRKVRAESALETMDTPYR